MSPPQIKKWGKIDHCTEEEGVEALKGNFHGTLIDQKEGDSEYLHHLLVQYVHVKMKNKYSKFQNCHKKMVNPLVSLKVGKGITIWMR